MVIVPGSVVWVLALSVTATVKVNVPAVVGGAGDPGRRAGVEHQARRKLPGKNRPPVGLDAADGKAVGVVGDAGTGTAGYSGDDGPATSAELSAPYGAAVTADGGCLIADSNNRVVRRVSPGN